MSSLRAMFTLLLVTAVGLATFSCSDSEEDKKEQNPGTGLPAITAVMGQVFDTDGSGLAGVSVEGGSAQATTSSDGTFQLDTSAGALVLTFEKQGYVKTFKRVDVQDGTPTALRVTLIDEAPAIELDADSGGAVAGARGAAINAPESAFVDGTGAPVSGTVQVHLTPLDPSVASELAAYPGDLAARRTDGTTAQLETYGVLDVTVRQGDEELQIAGSKTVEIRIPAPASGVTSPPATVGLWSFDEAAGVWVEEGQATYNAEDNTYDATISHLSPWNADAIQDSTCVRGKVQDQYGNAIPGPHRGKGRRLFGLVECDDGVGWRILRRGSEELTDRDHGDPPAGRGYGSHGVQRRVGHVQSARMRELPRRGDVGRNQGVRHGPRRHDGRLFRHRHALRRHLRRRLDGYLPLLQPAGSVHVQRGYGIGDLRERCNDVVQRNVRNAHGSRRGHVRLIHE